MGRIFLFAAALGGAVWGQSMIEGAALAAGSTVGGVAGKGVSSGITKIMRSTSKQLEAAAKTGAVPPPPPLLQVGVASVPKQTPYNVPPPPPLRSEMRKPAPVAEVKSVEPEAFEYVPPPLPPPVRPTMSAEDLATVKSGMRVSDVLSLGRNAVRVMRVVDGRLEETLRYRDGDAQLGIVRIVDGRVASVDLDN